MASEELALGIDLGTSNSCVAVVRNGVPEVLADKKGDRVHGSVVSFQGGRKVLVGNVARKYIITHPAQTVNSAKRLMGRFYFSDEIRKAKARYAYDIVEGPNSSVLVQIGQQQLTPQDIGALVLKKMKRVAEAALGVEVNRAVVTVPAYFNDNQRQATRDAGRIAGLDVLRIINEPTAAALAFGFGKGLQQRIAVYDLGGGTFDVSILEIGQDIYEVISTAGDTYLGGDDIDERIVDFLVNNFFQKHNINLRDERRTLPLLTQAAEAAKQRLSTQSEVNFQLPAIIASPEGKPLDLEDHITSTMLARMVMDLVQRTFRVCDEALQSARMVAADLDGVILVGGPTHLPFIREAVQHYFGKVPLDGVHPEEVVALGAALQANALVNVGPPTMLLDVTPLSLRIATVGGYSETIIDRNTPIPIERTKTFTTAQDRQHRVRVQVLQGESRRAEECETLGQFEFTGFRVAARGEVQIEVCFEIDASGIVNVSARDKETGAEASTAIHLSGGMTKDSIEQSIQRTHSTQFDDTTGVTDIVALDELDFDAGDTSSTQIPPDFDADKTQITKLT